MLSKRSKEVLFTQADWDEADATDRLYMHLLQPYDFPVSWEQEEKLEGLRQVWAIMCKHLSQRKRIKMISDVVKITERTAYRYMDEAKYLFGDIFQIDADLELAMLREKYYLLGAKAEKEKDYEVAKRCYDAARQIVMDIRDNTPKERREFAAVLFTSNPKALTQKLGDADEIDFEDLTQGCLLEPEAVRVSPDEETL